ncbi:phospholipid/glycerol acyltransferase [Pirellula staleyi DSM 6068]|uniref:Phospholipid/glycerol acyltransferase n=1 Tax=Pirellula staleyi (strain ATCC 27377 / DSM 6068 / ICPB 4128) TaxID=530564 RepID=D2R4S5_PIRSD|nr:lysophospholipid acyltransferase family protein [Pirellula staleyi]ADB17141.1 phospholipid/glycerol acyltransferase [Pirellula staleyi DSM 6068]
MTLTTTQAIGFSLGALALGLLVVMIVNMARSRMNPLQCVLWVLAWLIAKLWWRAQLPGPVPLPENVGAILVVNHRSSVDPFFVQTATGRKVHWMVAREYCESAAFGWFLRAVEVIPVNRGGVDTQSTKAALRLTAAGGLVGMFPEGRINMTDEFMLPVRPGVAMIALKSKVPLLPCYIEGSPYGGTAWSPFLMRARVKVKYGDPIDITEYLGREHEEGVLEELTLRAVKALAELAGKPDFEPKLAGKKWKPTQEELDADVARLKEKQSRDEASGAP